MSEFRDGDTADLSGAYYRARAVGGMDLSLTSTGAARIEYDGAITTATLKPPHGLSGHRRMTWVLDRAGEFVQGCGLIVIEGPRYGDKPGKYYHEGAGLWWNLTRGWYLDGMPYGVVPPSSLKKYATGNGGPMTKKPQVLAAIMRLYPGSGVDGYDQADAFILAAMGRDWLGRPVGAPQTPELRAQQRAVLDRCSWPPVIDQALIGDAHASAR